MAINPEHPPIATLDAKVAAIENEVSPGNDAASETRANYNDPARFLISDLCYVVEDYMSPEQVKEIYQAYLFGAQAHEGSVRRGPDCAPSFLVRRGRYERPPRTNLQEA